MHAFASRWVAISLFGAIASQTIPASAATESARHRVEISKHVRRYQDANGTTLEFSHLKNRAANHHVPDAMVHLPNDFDSSKPIYLVVYNHGWRNSAKSDYDRGQLGNQVDAPNTVLIAPEWQRQPASSHKTGYEQGHFANPNRFSNMVQEIFDKTPELRGKTINDVSGITLVAHSAGHAPSEIELNNNGLFEKVKRIVSLDSAYGSTAPYENWIEANAKALAANDGSQQFISFYNDTAAHNLEEAERVLQMLNQKHLPTSGMIIEKNGNDVDLSKVSDHSIIFQRSDMTVDGDGPHGSMPILFMKTALGGNQQASSKPQ